MGFHSTRFFFQLHKEKTRQCVTSTHNQNLPLVIRHISVEDAILGDLLEEILFMGIEGDGKISAPPGREGALDLIIL